MALGKYLHSGIVAFPENKVKKKLKNKIFERFKISFDPIEQRPKTHISVYI